MPEGSATTAEGGGDSTISAYKITATTGALTAGTAAVTGTSPTSIPSTGITQ